jgi:hypothetical protein
MLVTNQLDEGTMTGAEAVKQMEKSVLSGDNRARWVYGALLVGLSEKSDKTGKPYGIKLDKNRGANLLNKACQGGDPWGCAMYGMLGFLDGAKKVTLAPDDVAFAVQANAQLCKPSLPFNCIAASSLVSMSIADEKDPEKIKASITKGLSYAKIPCESKKNETACALQKTLQGALDVLNKKK